MSDGFHLLIPFAISEAPACHAALAQLQLPQLRRLLARLGPAGDDGGSLESLSTPHERAWAQHHGWPVADGLVPLAAWQARGAGLGPAPPGEGWACITPCHWRVGSDHVAMAHLEELQLDDAQDAALLALARPYFHGDGIELYAQRPGHWLARGPVFHALPTASLERAAGRTLDRWMPRDQAARPLRRLQQEFQMLLYTDPFNDHRQARGLLPINSFWASGTGDLPPPGSTASPALRVADALREPALHEDAAAWAAAWQQLDAGDIAAAVQAAEAGAAVRLTLCGEQGARSWSTAGAGGWGGLLRRLRPTSPTAAMEGL